MYNMGKKKGNYKKTTMKVKTISNKPKKKKKSK